MLVKVKQDVVVVLLALIVALSSMVNNGVDVNSLFNTLISGYIGYMVRSRTDDNDQN